MFVLLCYEDFVGNIIVRIKNEYEGIGRMFGKLISKF